MNQPLIPVVLLMVAGVVLGEWVDVPVFLLFVISFVVSCLALFLCVFNREKFGLMALGAACLLAGWTDMACHDKPLSPNDLRLLLGEQAADVTVGGVVDGAPAEQVFQRGRKELERSRLKLKVSRISMDGRWRAAFGTVMVMATGPLPADVVAGQEVEAKGVIGRPRGPAASGLFNPRTFYQRQEIYYGLYVDSADAWRVVGIAAGVPISQRFVTWAREALAAGLPVEDDPLRLIWALVLDWKEPLRNGFGEAFVRAGTFHIFAVDGLRIGMLAGIGVGLLRALRVGRGISGLVMIPVIWSYAGLTGWPASAVRATIMMTVVILGWVVRRPWNLVNSLFAAAVIILAWNPQQLFQAGFQMSFVVLLCIALLVPAIRYVLGTEREFSLRPKSLERWWERWSSSVRRWAVDALAVSLAAWLGSAPLAANYFHVFTAVSGPANFVVVPLTGLALMSSLGSLLTTPICPAAAHLFNHSAWLWMKWILGLSEWFAKWPGAYWNWEAPRAIGAGWYYLILLTVCTGWLFGSRHRRGVMVVIAVVTAAWLGDWALQSRISRIDVLSLRDTPAIYARSTGAAGRLLLDCGNLDSAEMVVKPFLEAQGVNRLGNFCLTVARAASMAGGEVVLTNFTVGEVYAGEARARSGVYRQLLARLEEERRHWTALKDGSEVDGWQVLGPDASKPARQADDGAVVLRKVVKGQEVLLLSSLGRSGQDALVAGHADLRAEVVVAALPARDEPLSEPLLDLAHPKLVIIADSEYAADRRAPEKLKERLARRGIPVVYCHDIGAVTLVLRSGRIEVEDAEGKVVARVEEKKAK